MALSRFGEGDTILGQNVGSGTEVAFVPAMMLVDSTGAELPAGGTAIAGTSGNVANASAAASLAAIAAKTNYVTGVEFTFSGATAASVVVATVTGLLGGTQSYIVAVPAGAVVGGTPLLIKFHPPHPASAVNTAITATIPALGAGNTNACANIRGIQK
jgi:hypothetical protein